LFMATLAETCSAPGRIAGAAAANDQDLDRSCL
jgi:hypothetical protein